MRHTENNHKLFAIILFWVLQLTIILAQRPTELTLNFTEIQKGTTTIEQSSWGNISLEKGETLYLGFAASEAAFFRVFLNGVLIEPKLIESYYTLKDLSAGTHIFKLIAYNKELMESAPLLLSFSVTEKIIVGEKKIEAGEQHLINPVLVYGLVIMCAVLFGVILILLFKKNNNSTDTSTKLVEELSDLKYSYKRVKEELAQEQEENENLKARIQELDYSVKTLEKANVHLVEQKEKLAASKTKLEILHKQKEEMFAIAIHDIKNPASAIRGYIELLNSYELNANEQQEIMASLVASSEDIVKLSQDMCVIIAKAMPEPKLKLQTASLKNLVDDVFNQNASYAKAKKVKFYNKNANELPDVKIDMEKIEEALDNIVNNAIKYAPPETIVELRSYVKDLNKKLVVVEVKDNGVGLSDADLKRSFQKGAVLSAKPTGFEQSSGLGLWIVKKIIEEHNGKVWVESKEGVGSTFAFELPYE
ncbi:MAG: histidine kinase [Ignavibacteria bacterium]|nr:MAG: histidine kinase [Ignavibacteria bacterium]KAF0160321.1 MAG: histidine kinase [Ignavibacteria bacterium]